jgi:hypothetical protein
LSEQTIIDNLSKVIDDSWGLGNPNGDGIGPQFILYSQATISRVAFRMKKNDLPTGTFRAYLYTSDGAFQSMDAFADELIAQSTNIIDIEDLPTVYSNVSFFFDNVVLEPGTYFVCIKTTDINSDQGWVQVAMTSNSVSQLGYVTWWDPYQERWRPWSDD